MLLPNLDDMRARLKKHWACKGWDTRRLRSMPPNQLAAIYKDLIMRQVQRQLAQPPHRHAA